MWRKSRDFVREGRFSPDSNRPAVRDRSWRVGLCPRRICLQKMHCRLCAKKRQCDEERAEREREQQSRDRDRDRDIYIHSIIILLYDIVYMVYGIYSIA